MYTANSPRPGFVPQQILDWQVLGQFEGTREDTSEVMKQDEELQIAAIYRRQDELESSTFIDPILEYLSARVYSIVIPDKWRLEEISAPTIRCKEIGSEIVRKLYKNYSIIPDRVSATVEGGIYLRYEDYRSENSLSIEVYNDLDIAAIVTKKKEILGSFDINDQNVEETIRIFKKI